MNAAPGLAALLATSMLLAACQKEEEASTPEPRPVLSVIARAEPPAQLMLAGTVEARVETQYGFRILGRVVARNVKTGDLVMKGDVLAAIDPLALELSVKSAQSDLSNSEAQFANALANEERQKTLFDKQSGAKATYETAQLERRTAEAGVAKARANLDKAKEQLGYSRLPAEFDGVVTSTSAEVGQVVSAGQRIATVARPQERDAVIDLPEEASEHFPPGSVFDVSLQLDPTVHAKGIVREIAPVADDATRTRHTRITLVDPPVALRLGSVVTATAIAKDKPVIRIPSSAIRMDGPEANVWIVDPAARKVLSRPVQLEGGPGPQGEVTIAEGIAPGERVVVAGVHKLEEGQPVRVDQEMIK